MPHIYAHTEGPTPIALTQGEALILAAVRSVAIGVMQMGAITAMNAGLSALEPGENRDMVRASMAQVLQDFNENTLETLNGMINAIYRIVPSQVVEAILTGGASLADPQGSA